jgi:hypothetical protein
MAPKRRGIVRYIAPAVVVVAWACGDQALVTAPVSIHTPAPVPPVDTSRVSSSRTYTISGRVTERSATGDVASAGAYVNAWIQQTNFGYAYWYRHGRIVADDSGYFRLPSVPAGATAQLQVWKDGFVQQCAAPLVTIQSDTRIDGQLVARDKLSVSSPPEPAPGFRHVTGVVSDGGKPVAGAFVDYEPIPDYVGAFTFTDNDGRFLLCGLPMNQTVMVGVGFEGRVVWVEVPPSQRDDVAISLPR